MLERYETNENIPFVAYIADGNGNPISGEEVRTTVIDLANPATPVLNRQAMPETSQPGYYFYDWVHGFTISKRLIAIVFEVSNNKDIILEAKKIFISDTRNFLENKIDENDGQAI